MNGARKFVPVTTANSWFAIIAFPVPTRARPGRSPATSRAKPSAEKVTTLAGGPGIGIQLRHGPHAGRLLFPFCEGPYGLWRIYAVYSDDRGRTWQRGETVPGGLIYNANGGQTSMVNEAQLVELQDGLVRFNVRHWAGRPVRKTSVSRDGGVNWSKIDDAAELRDPGCMASVLRYSDPAADGTGKSRILYSGPLSRGREHGTVLISFDEGATWPVRLRSFRGASAIPCLSRCRIMASAVFMKPRELAGLCLRGSRWAGSRKTKPSDSVPRRLLVMRARITTKFAAQNRRQQRTNECRTLRPHPPEPNSTVSLPWSLARRAESAGRSRVELAGGSQLLDSWPREPGGRRLRGE